MKDYLISSYIDDELNLDEKIEFVETVHEKVSFKDETVDLLHQEKLICGEVADRVPAVIFRAKPRFSISLWRPGRHLRCWGLAAALLVMFLVTPAAGANDADLSPVCAVSTGCEPGGDYRQLSLAGKLSP